MIGDWGRHRFYWYLYLTLIFWLHYFIIIFRKLWILVTDHARVFKARKMVLTKRVFVFLLSVNSLCFQNKFFSQVCVWDFWRRLMELTRFSPCYWPSILQCGEFNFNLYCISCIRMDACKIKRTVKISYTISKLFASPWIFYLFQSHFYILFLNNNWSINLNCFRF